MYFLHTPLLLVTIANINNIHNKIKLTNPILNIVILFCSIACRDCHVSTTINPFHGDLIAFLIIIFNMLVIVKITLGIVSNPDNMKYLNSLKVTFNKQTRYISIILINTIIKIIEITCEFTINPIPRDK